MTHSKNLTVGAIQQSCTANSQENLAYSGEQVALAASKGAELVVLQELHSTLYFCQEQNPHNCELAESIPGPTTEQLSVIAKKHEIVLVGSIFEECIPGLYHNTAVVFEKDGSMAGKYRKMHIPDDPGYNEKFYFTPGDLGFTPIQTSVGKLGVLVCWDQWFPEAARWG